MVAGIRTWRLRLLVVVAILGHDLLDVVELHRRLAQPHELHRVHVVQVNHLHQPGKVSLL